MDPAKWINFHKDKAKKESRQKSPEVGTYKMNYPVEYDTFGKMLAKSEDKD